ncbi:GtrA family protein [Levilactobacillus bambusae]|uniref:GtrA/DPMS transmembrane domain-containing protein n=1 Tax=Levilactobacillus bambusae TaxID=2024736 RepID=A0A2V1N4H1_9LACO|nr:GtrA family protein [Levilactobacillus bambusae]PWG00845.1 hypothetical protein DCM90_01315 [Levilactobacillus bambusae]
MQKLIDLYHKYETIILYLFWGGVTTLVDIVAFVGLHSGLHWNYQVANTIAWFLSVLVAYLTNKVWVFGSHYTTPRALLVEAAKFFFYRGLTLILDDFIMWVGISVLDGNSLVVKLIDQIIIVVANYVFSKWLIFKETETIKK